MSEVFRERITKVNLLFNLRDEHPTKWVSHASESFFRLPSHFKYHALLHTFHNMCLCTVFSKRNTHPTPLTWHPHSHSAMSQSLLGWCLFFFFRNKKKKEQTFQPCSCTVREEFALGENDSFWLFCSQITFESQWLPRDLNPRGSHSQLVAWLIWRVVVTHNVIHLESKEWNF